MPRPVYSFRRFVGHKKHVNLLRRQLTGAKARGEPFPPTLFAGPSGIGKTLLAQSLAEEYGTRLYEANGYDTVPDLCEKLKRLSAGDFLFIDEIHNLCNKGQELLYSVIDTCRLPRWEQLDASPQSPQTDVNNYTEIAPCSIILATDRPGKLLNALDKRMELNVRLGYYSEREMREIVDRLAATLELLISPQGAGLIAQVSHGIPRKAKHHLQNLRRHLLDNSDGQISLAQVRSFLQDFGIDGRGFDRAERNYLRYLAGTEPASLESLALHLGMDDDYVRRQIEPILKRAGLTQIGAGGRRLTDAGKQWINRHNPQSSKG